MHHLVRIRARAGRAGCRLRVVLEAHEGLHLGSQGLAVEFQGFFTAAVEEQVRLNNVLIGYCGHRLMFFGSVELFLFIVVCENRRSTNYFSVDVNFSGRSGISRTGRISTVPLRAPGIFSATRIADSKFSVSMRKYPPN